ncbi:MAG: hypothetical protein HN936_13625 [Bacteroidetes bacterium]|jgi:hypothetical protein|nr:hypothetical protein [Chloroflexota bacterium]MBT7094280.1 hypothetical protein [Bacteroidota bacterium]
MATNDTYSHVFVFHSAQFTFANVFSNTINKIGMDMIDSNAGWNNRLSKVWEDHSEATKELRSPAYQSSLKKNAILFVGMNPSFSLARWTTLLKEKEIDDDPESYFSWDNRHIYNRTLSLDFNSYTKNKYSYFKPMREFAVNLGLEWDHADSFFIRETNQSKVKSLVLEKNDPKRLSGFGKVQYELAIELIVKSVPKAIIVTNALASHIWKNRFKLNLIDQGTGTYNSTINGTDVPTFLSGMLTGQRALDVHSRERLFWHVKRLI